MFVGNLGGSWLTEVDISRGTLVRVISATPDRLSNPDGMALFGNKLFVADSRIYIGAGGGWVTGLRA
jgi:hypothetical protein